MIDIHSHILPNVDDGSQSLTESLEMLRIAIDDGVTKQVLTPHIQFGRFNNTKKDLQKHFNEFKKEVAVAGLQVDLQLSAEVRIGPEIMQLVKQNGIPWLGEYKGYKTFLLEFPRNDVPHGSDNLIRWLLNNNCLPIIAHPERNRTFVDRQHKLQALIDLGCPLQLTASSLIGRFGKDVQSFAHSLLDNGDVVLIASDCHNLKGRQPDLGKILPKLEQVIIQRIESQTPLFCNEP